MNLWHYLAAHPGIHVLVMVVLFLSAGISFLASIMFAKGEDIVEETPEEFWKTVFFWVGMALTALIFIIAAFVE